jgi:hypothetical protein
MASLVLSGDTSGSITLAAPAVAGSTTQTLVNVTGTLAPIVSGTAVASTSGTSVDFTGIPSWVKRITVMLSAVSTNGTSLLQCQIGSGSVTTSGYAGGYSRGTTAASATSGLIIQAAPAAASTYYGSVVFYNLTGNTWLGSSNTITANSDAATLGNASVALSGALDRVRITTVNGTDTFDAGTINILYE